MTHVGAIVDGHGQIAGTIGAIEQGAPCERPRALGYPSMVHTDEESVARRVANNAVPEQTRLATAFTELEDAAFGAGGAELLVSNVPFSETPPIRAGAKVDLPAWSVWGLS